MVYPLFFPTERGPSELSPPSPETASSTLGGPEHKMDHWLEPGWQFGAPCAAGQLPEEAACRAECFSAAICSYTRHSEFVPFPLTKQPLGLLLSFSSFLKAAASQESPCLWHSVEDQASQLSCILSFIRPLLGCLTLLVL